MDTRGQIFKESSNSHKLLDSNGYTDQAREWAATLDERIIEKDNNKKRLEGKTPLVRVNTDPTREDLSDAEIVDDGKPLPRKGGGNPPPRRKRRK